MRLLIFCGWIALMLAGCEGGSRPGAVLKNEAEAIHDEAMKDGAAINRVGRALKEVLKTMDSTAADQQAQRAEIMEVLVNLEKAEIEMSDWMAGYEPATDPSGTEGERYYMVQKQKIEQNHRNIRAALAAGDKMLKSQQ